MTDLSQTPMAGRTQPDRQSIASHDRLVVLDHPLVDHLLATIRDSEQDAGAFGRAASQLATAVIWAATGALRTNHHTVRGFDGSELGVQRVAPNPAAVSILRAGEVFSGPFRQMFPQAPLYHLGIRRDEETLGHRVYSSTIAETVSGQRMFILDPMLATGGSVLVAIDRIRAVFSGPVDVLALVSAPYGVNVVLESNPDVRIVTAALDDYLNERGFIVPGLGDAGDRFFGTTA